MSGMLLGLAGAALIAAGWAEWFRRLRAVRVPRNRAPFLAVMAAGACLGALAFAVGPGLVGGIAAGVALLGGGAFLGLRAISAQDARTPAVAVGGPVLDFEAADDQDRPFQLASLAGRSFLLKFFRGHW